MDTRNLTIAVLTITAVMLACTLFVVTLVAPTPAYAIGQTAAVDDYVITTGQFSQSSELVYVIDTAIPKLNVYELEHTRRVMHLRSSVSLARP